MFLKEEKLHMIRSVQTAKRRCACAALAMVAAWAMIHTAMIHTARADTPASAGESLILRAHALSGKANSDEQYTEVIETCRQASKHGLSVESVRYNNRLRSWAHNRRGEARQAAGDVDAAAVDFELAVGFDPLSWRALHNRALSSAHKRRWKRALVDLDKVLRFKREFAEAYFHRAEVLREMEQFAKARSDYDVYIDSRPADPEAYAGRGYVLFQLGKQKSAVRDLYNALKLDPQNVSALTFRGEVFTQLGYYDKAARDLRKAIQLGPDSARAYSSAAWLMATCPNERLRSAQLAIEAAEKAVKIAGKPAFRELDTLAAAQANNGDFDAAKQTLTRAMKRASNAQRRILAARLELYQKGQPYRLATKGKKVEVVGGLIEGPSFR
jgi:tetratricopeptide (TPR) repeat protein